ncbi:MAG: HAMP domain-containing histidine kinase [Planctomycetes bacterium]|nr:HAMP domain-containing histidine kinase [Planctomycetota bacterium]
MGMPFPPGGEDLVRRILARSRSLLLLSWISGALLLVVVAILVGNAARDTIHQTSYEGLVREANHLAEVFGSRIEEAVAGGEQDLRALAAREWVRSACDRITRQEFGILYVHLIDAGGHVAASSDQRNLARRWFGEETEKWLTLEERVERHATWDGPGEDPVACEIVQPIDSAEGRGLLVLGLSRDFARWAARDPARALWTGLAIGAAVTLALILALLAVQHRMAVARLALVRGADRSDRLREFALMAGGLAHEIRNPLNAIRFGLQSILRRTDRIDAPPLRDEIKGLTDEIAEEVAGLDEILNAFLRYARPSPEEAKTVDLGDVCASVLQFLQPEIESRRLAVTIRKPDPPVRGRLPEVQLRQILLNLLLNAAQASPPDGRIEVRVRQGRRRASIEVADTGPGIPPETRDRLFEPFFSTKKEGTGLGLAISRRLAEGMGGTLVYEPIEPHGSLFRLEVPIGAEEKG